MIRFVRALSSTPEEIAYLISWDFGVVQTFAALTVQKDRLVPKDATNELIHRRFFEFASILLAIAIEARGTFNLFR